MSKTHASVTNQRWLCWECRKYLAKASWRRHWNRKHKTRDVPPPDVGSNYQGEVKVAGGQSPTQSEIAENAARQKAKDDARVAFRVLKFTSTPQKYSAKRQGGQTNTTMPSPGSFKASSSPSTKVYIS